MARKTMHGMKTKIATAPRSRIPLSAAIRPLAGNEGVPQSAEPPNPVAIAQANPPMPAAPLTAGGQPSGAPRLMHFGVSKVARDNNYRLAKGEEISPAYDVTSRQESPAEHDKRVGNQRMTFNDNYTPNETVKSTGPCFLKKGETVIAQADSELPKSVLGEGRNSPDSLVKRDGRKRFDW